MIGGVPVRRVEVIGRIFHLADGQVYRQSDARRPDADSMGTIQAVARKAYFQPKILTLVLGARYAGTECHPAAPWEHG